MAERFEIPIPMWRAMYQVRGGHGRVLGAAVMIADFGSLSRRSKCIAAAVLLFCYVADPWEIGRASCRERV